MNKKVDSLEVHLSSFYILAKFTSEERVFFSHYDSKIIICHKCLSMSLML